MVLRPSMQKRAEVLYQEEIGHFPREHMKAVLNRKEGYE